MSESDGTRKVEDRLLGHAAVLVERLIFWGRNLGLLPRFNTDEDPLGSLCVADDEVATMLASLRRGRAGRAHPADPLRARADESRTRLGELTGDPELQGFGLVEILRSFALPDDALDAFVLALAPDWDLRFGRLFGFLNGDLSRQRPTVAHLRLLCGRGGEPPGAPLVAVESSSLPFPARTVHVPEHVIEISRTQLRASAPGAASWESLHLADGDRARLRESLSREIRRGTDDHRLAALEGHPGSGRLSAALAAAAAAGRAHVQLDLATEDPRARGRAIARALLQARLTGALVIARSDGVTAGSSEALTEIAQEAERHQVTCLVLVRPGEIDGVGGRVRFTRVVIPKLGARERRKVWAQAAARAGLALSSDAIDDVASRFELSPGRIDELARELQIRHGASAIGVPEAGTALRELTAEKLVNLASPYRGDLRLDQLIIPADVRARLEELITRLRYRYRVLDEWGFAADGGRGRGVTALFSGASGTGKTAAAGAVARALDIDLHIVDLSRVMSKWVGETEQNLARIFDEAEASGAALLFDEADALFGKRSTEMKSSSDRYANLTVNYLLQRIETFSGLAILTTNLESAIDAAFARRMSCRVEFPMPDAEQRLQLWRRLVPAGVGYAADVNLDVLVTRFKFPGARIRSAITRAAYAAAARGDGDERLLHHAELLGAAALEFEDMGRVLPSSAAGPASTVRLVG
jgi:hypothetical protein